MKKNQIIYLDYLAEFDCYGIAKDTVRQMKKDGVVPNLRMPQKVYPQSAEKRPELGMLLGQDKSTDGTEYYTIGKNYAYASITAGADLKLLDYVQPVAELKGCDGLILPGGSFNNPEDFYVDGKIIGDEVGERYWAYHDLIMSAYKNKLPMLGVCAGAQMIATNLGGAKMYRNMKDEIPQHAVHKPSEKYDVKLHQIKLKPDTVLFDILELDKSQDTLMINSRHKQSLVHPALQDYVRSPEMLKLDLYAVSDADGIPEIWGNEKAGILCVQGHPEDSAKDSKVMLNFYKYIVNKAKIRMNERFKCITKNNMCSR